MPRLNVKKRLPERFENACGGQLVGVRRKHKIDGLTEPALAHGLHQQVKQEDKQGGHQHLGRAFDAAADPGDDDADRDRHEDHVPRQVDTRGAENLSEYVADHFRFEARKGVGERQIEVMQRPARNHAVEAENDKPADHAHPADQAPGGAFAALFTFEHLEGPDR